MEHLKGILIVGPRNEITDKQRELYDKPGYMILGDGKEPVSKETIKENLSERVGPKTRIDIHAHGLKEDGNHYIQVIDKRGCTTTIGLLLLLNNLTEFPLYIHLWSCYGGVANGRGIYYLKTGSILATYVESESSALVVVDGLSFERSIELYQEREGIDSPAQMHADSLKFYPQVSTFSYRREEEEVFRHTIVPFGGIVVDVSPERIRELLTLKADEFIDRWNNFSGENVLSKCPRMSNAETKEYLALYDLHRLYVRADHVVDFVSSTNNTKLIDDMVYWGALRVAAEAGELSELRAFLDRGVSPDTKNFNNETALIGAVKGNQERVIDVLLEEYGADLEAEHKNGIRALAYASSIGNTEAVIKLLEHGADPNLLLESEEVSMSPLILTIQQNHVEAMNMLLEHGADPNLLFESEEVSMSPLMFAVVLDNMEAVVELLKHGADLNARDVNGHTALMSTENSKVARVLIKYGATFTEEDLAKAELSAEQIKEIAEELARQSELEGVLIVGPDITITDKQKELYDKPGYMILGDGEEPVSKETIKENLSERVGPKTRIDIHAHGETKGKIHYIAVVDEERTIATSLFLSFLNKLTEFPLYIHLWSCYGGVANGRGIYYLKTGSILATYVESESSALVVVDRLSFERSIELYQEREGIDSPAQMHADSLKFYPQVSTFSYRREEEEVFQHTIVPFGGIVVDVSPERIRELLTLKADEFIDRWNNFSGENLLSKCPEMSNAETKEYLALYDLHRLVIHEDHIIDFIKTANNTKLIDDMVYWGALTLAAGGGELSELRAFLDIGIHPDTKNYNNETALIGAVKKNQGYVIDVLVKEYGSDVEAEHKNGIRALQYAISIGNTEAVIKLLEHGANPNATIQSEDCILTPLMFALTEDNMEAVKVLLEHGANPNATIQSEDGIVTTLMFALIIGNAEVIRLLIANGALSNDIIPLVHSIIEKDAVMLNEFIVEGIDLNIQSNEGLVPLMFAVSINNVEAMIILIDNGADLNARDVNGYTVLMYASTVGCVEVVTKLLDYDMDVNAIACDGTTALMSAETPEVAEVLIRRGADVNARDSSGNTALIEAETPEVAEILIKYGATFTEEDLAEAELPAAQIKEIAEELARQSELEGVLIVGPDMILSSHIMKLYNKPGYMILGDEEESLSLETIQLRLAGRIGARTRIDIVAHGIADGSVHKVMLIMYKFGLFKGVTRHDTKSLFKVLDGLTDSPLYIHLWSCFAGAANKDIEFLKSNSTLITHVEKENPSSSSVDKYSLEKSIGVYQELGYETSIAQEYTDSLKFFPQTSSFCYKGGSDEIFEHTVKVFRGKFIDEPLHIVNSFIESETGNFITKWEEFSSKRLLQDYSNISDTEFSDYLALHNLHRLYVQEDHMVDFIRSTNNTRLIDDIVHFGGISTVVGVGNILALEAFLDKGIHVDVKDYNGIIPLRYAIRENQLYMIDSLLEHGADPDSRDPKGATPLMNAISLGNTEAMLKLINGGADVNAVGKKGVTPLMIAAMIGYGKSIMVLIENGADLNLRRDNGKTAMMIAVEDKNIWAMNELIKGNIDLEIRDDVGRTVLVYAVMGDYLEGVTKLLERGADPNVIIESNNISHSPLTLAVISDRSPEIIDVLLRYEAQPNVVFDEYKVTLLMLTKNPEVAKLLIKYGATFTEEDLANAKLPAEQIKEIAEEINLEQEATKVLEESTHTTCEFDTCMMSDIENAKDATKVAGELAECNADQEVY